MGLTPGTRLGPYEIVSPLGAGGMGEVYRARDTALNRDVAIKVLSDRLADDPDRLARFQREAEALAALNHPNIAAIYGIERGGDTPALVMELVEGRDLSEVIARGQPEAESASARLRDSDSAARRGGVAPRGLNIDEALPIARQIAEALDAAHQAGIVHRDLKPANIKVRDDGTVKVLDFGLAKALGPDSAISSADSLANSPTLTARATQAGMILGTAAYMSPEQARGRPVDKRADIWAFGVVLYEMVMGTRLFAGEDLTETLASVVKDRPDFSAAPREVQRLLDRCLQKNPKDRLRDIGDAWALLESATTSAGDAEAAAPSAPPSKLPWLVAAAAATAAVVLAVLYVGRTAPSPETSRFQVLLPPSADAIQTLVVALSPDGRHVATLIENKVWVRSFDVMDAFPLEGTEGASYPFWSPDSASVGFFADGQLKTVARTGGLVRTVTAAAEGRGAAWSPNGTIVFSPDSGGRGLFAVPAEGGAPRRVTTLTASGTDDAHRYPQFLPDGERFLYLHLTSVPDVQGVYLTSLDGTTPTRILEGSDQAMYATPMSGEHGYLLFRRDSVLMAQGLDIGALRAVGAPVPIADNVGQAQNTGSGAFSVSANGTLAYASEGAAELAWFGRSGERLDVLTDAGPNGGFSVSRNQRRLAVSIGVGGADVDVHLQDLAGGSPSRFTYGPRPGWAFPVWAPDGSWVAYSTYDLAGQASYEIRRKPTDMSGAEETLLSVGSNVYVWDWTRDGSHLVYEYDGDIYLLPLTGDRKPVPFLETPAAETHAQVSPDGRWMAYASDAQGDRQVYVKSIPPTGSLWQISTGGGTMPRWRDDGRELYYRASDGTLTAVAVGANLAREGPAASSFEYTPRQVPLFGGLPSFGNLTRSAYQPSADGQRFAVITVARDADTTVAVVLNWQADVAR